MLCKNKNKWNSNPNNLSIPWSKIKKKNQKIYYYFFSEDLWMNHFCIVLIYWHVASFNTYKEKSRFVHAHHFMWFDRPKRQQRGGIHKRTPTFIVKYNILDTKEFETYQATNLVSLVYVYDICACFMHIYSSKFNLWTYNNINKIEFTKKVIAS